MQEKTYHGCLVQIKKSIPLDLYCDAKQRRSDRFFYPHITPMKDSYNPFFFCYYDPNFEEVERAYWFQNIHASVHPSVCQFVSLFDACHILWTVDARVLKFQIWIPHGKIADTHLFFLSEFCPFLELCPFEKIRKKSDACHVLWILHARVLKFHTWIPHGK